MFTRDTIQDINVAVGHMSQQATLDYHKKHIQALWRHIERLENVVQVIPEGVKIKSGFSEILVLKNGGIIVDGQRILIKTPQKTVLSSL